MDRKYPNALAYIKIEAVIRVKQKLWAVKIWAKMIWKQPSSFGYSIHFADSWLYKIKQIKYQNRSMSHTQCSPVGTPGV